MYIYEYIDHLGLYRIFDPDHPEQTVAYLDAADLALVLLEDPDGDRYSADTTVETRDFMNHLRKTDPTARNHHLMTYLWSENRKEGRRRGCNGGDI